MLALDLPRRMQISFYRVVQERSEQSGKEMTSKDITTAFRQTYHLGGSIFDGSLVLKSFNTSDLRTPSTPHSPALDAHEPTRSRIASLSLSSSFTEASPDRNQADLASSPKKLIAKVVLDGKPRQITGEGNGPLSSFLDALSSDLGFQLSIREYSEHAVGIGSDVKAATYVELIPPNANAQDKTKGGYWGIGIDADITASGLKAVVSAVNGWLDETRSDSTGDQD